MRGCVLPIDRTLIDKLKILGLLLICVIFFPQCVTGLQQCVSSEAVELISLLGRYEIEGLLYAHDRIGGSKRAGVRPRERARARQAAHAHMLASTKMIGSVGRCEDEE